MALHACRRAIDDVFSRLAIRSNKSVDRPMDAASESWVRRSLTGMGRLQPATIALDVCSPDPHSPDEHCAVLCTYFFDLVDQVRDPARSNSMAAGVGSTPLVGLGRAPSPRPDAVVGWTCRTRFLVRNLDQARQVRTWRTTVFPVRNRR